MVTFDLFAPAPSSESTSSAADSRARTSALPGAVRVSTASAADYGSSTPDSLASFDRATSSWRTSQLSLDGDSTAFSETLPRSGTMRNGTLYRLPPLVRLIAGIGSGSLLPTPCESNADRGGGGESRGPGGGRGGSGGAMLPPPPAASATNRQTRYAQGGMPLTMAAQLLPTPTAGDATGSGSRNTPTSKAHPGVSLTDWALGDGGKGRRMLPTPRAAEWKGVGPIGSKSHLHRLSRGYLDATMQERSGATGRLNPRFVEWMMGFPPGWTEVDSPASETRSSRK